MTRSPGFPSKVACDGRPPALVIIGEAAMLRDEGEAYAAKAATALSCDVLRAALHDK